MRPAENLFAWVKSGMKDLRDELETMRLAQICKRVLELFKEAGQDGRAFKWARRCRYDNF